MKIEIVLEVDNYDHDQFYSGHGHSFEPDNFIGCVSAIVPAIQGESVGGLAERIFQEANSQDWEFTVEYETSKAFKVTNDEVREAIREGIGESIDSDQPFGEEWMFYAYLHFYEEED